MKVRKRIAAAVICTMMAGAAWLPSRAQDLPEPIHEKLTLVEQCYSDTLPCDAAFGEAVLAIEAMTDDTLAALSYRKLATIREHNGGLWDSLLEDLIIRARSRYEQVGDPCLVLNSQFSLTRYSLFLDDTQITVDRALEGIELAEECGDLSEIAHAYSFLGAAYTRHGMYKLAIENLFEAERIYTGLNDISGLAMVNLDLSETYAMLRDDSASLHRNKMAVDQLRQTDEKVRFAVAVIDMCDAYIQEGMTDSVLKYLPEAYEMVKDVHPLAVVYASQRLGQAHLAEGDIDVAIGYFEESLSRAQALQVETMHDMNLSFLSEAHLRKGDLDEAMKYARELDHLTRADSLGRQRLMAVERLAETYAAMGQFEPAYRYHLDILKIREHMLKQEQRSEIIKLEAAYRAEQRENEIILAQQEVALLSEKNKAATNRSYALASAIVMLVVFGVAMVNRHRRKSAMHQAQIKLKEAENTLLTAEVMHKNRELTTAALHLAQRNELLAKFKEKWKQTADKNDLKGESKRAMKSLKIDEQMNRNIEEFSELFVKTNPEFYQSLAGQNNELTKSELRLAALIRMNLDSKQIASLLSISDAAIKKGRYRLRKKLQLESEENLDAYIMRV